MCLFCKRARVALRSDEEVRTTLFSAIDGRL